MSFGAALPHELDAVRALYRRNDYSGGMRATDRVCVAREGAAVIAAVRLCDEYGYRVLRGMFVDAGHRGQGLGGNLLTWLLTEIGETPCWCIPYANLQHFYARAGFRVVLSGDSPAFLAERAAGYQQDGPPVVIMRRP